MQDSLFSFRILPFPVFLEQELHHFSEAHDPLAAFLHGCRQAGTASFPV